MRRRRRGYVPGPRYSPDAAAKVYRYDSLAALVTTALTGASTMSDGERSSRSRTLDGGGRRGGNWAGGSWEGASKLAVQGDIAGAKRLAPAILEAVNASVKNLPRLDPVYKLDEGQAIDVARYVRGEPECWLDMVEAAPIQRRGAAVVVNVAASYTVSSNDLDRVGVAIGSAILGLQAQGYTVTLYAAECIGGYTNKTLNIVAPVNPGGIPLDVARLSVILRPWFLRRIIFSLNETFDQTTRSEFGIPGSYGSVLSLRQSDAARLSGTDNAVVVNVNDAVRYPDSVAQAITDQIKGDK